jgi:hypothetical protein
VDEKSEEWKNRAMSARFGMSKIKNKKLIKKNEKKRLEELWNSALKKLMVNLTY